MTNVLILYYSMYGHIERMADAVAAGIREVPGAEATLRRVPELMPEHVARNAGAKLDQSTPVADPDELGDYDAIIIGTPTRFGNMSGQMRNFLDQTGQVWLQGKLENKVGSVFTSTGTGGGNESTILSTWLTLAHWGMIIVGLTYSEVTELWDISEMRGGSPYGAGTLAGDGSRQPSEIELSMAHKQGRRVAQTARRLAGTEVESVDDTPSPAPVMANS